eukprot:1161325-Pelagomonas_calceolata.AAC.20
MTRPRACGGGKFPRACDGDNVFKLACMCYSTGVIYQPGFPTIPSSTYPSGDPSGSAANIPQREVTRKLAWQPAADQVPIVSPSASFSPPPPVVTQTLPAAQAQTAQAVYTGPSPHAVSPAYTGSPYAVSSPPTSPHAGVAQPPSTPPMGAVPYMMAGLPGQPPVVGYILPYQQVCTLFLQRCKFHCVVVCCLYIMAGLRGQPPLVADMLPYRQVERDGVAAIITSFSPLPCFENTGFRTGSLGCASLPHLDAGGRIRGVKGLRCHIVTQ